jgi:hypothetical protein
MASARFAWALVLLAGCGGTDAEDAASGVATGAGATGSSSTTGAGGGGSLVPELGGDGRKLTVIATSADGLDVPRDLGFAPDHPDQLWTIDTGFEGVVIFTQPGEAGQTAEKRMDAFAPHFMAHVSSLAFGVANRFGSCQESRDPWNDAPQPEDDFMGPTLWLADLDVFAKVGQTMPFNPTLPEGSHIDMLHESPLCMGIAHDHDNAYWAFDGKNGQLVYYDFVMDHGPGGSDHSDGIVRRYVEATVTRLAEVPGHLVLDPASGWLYVADTGKARVMRLDTKSGAPSGKATTPPDFDGLDEYSIVQGAKYEVFAEGLGEPSGIELANGRLFVGDHASGDIIAFDLEGHELARAATGASALAGLAIGPDAKLWFVDAAKNELVRIDP